jgi:hypothetical protein
MESGIRRTFKRLEQFLSGVAPTRNRGSAEVALAPVDAFASRTTESVLQGQPVLYLRNRTGSTRGAFVIRTQEAYRYAYDEK